MRGTVLLMALLLQLAEQSAMASVLQARVVAAHSRLGEPVQLIVELPVATPSLAEMRLEGLRKDFLVQDVTYDTGGPRHTETDKAGAQIMQRMTASLYPLRSGRVTIPALRLRGWRSEAITLSVHAPQPGDGPRVRSGGQEVPVWEREAARVWIDIEDATGAAEITVTAPTGAALYARALAIRERSEQRDGRRISIRRHAWAVSALRGGDIKVHFPMVKIRLPRRGGAVVLRYPPDPVVLQVKPLPVYIPVETPVGPLSLVDELTGTALWAGETYDWKVRISGSSLSLQGIKSLLKPQLADTGMFRFYPPTYRWLRTDGKAPLQQALEVQIPFVARQAGNHSLPALVLPYVDAASGRMVSATLVSRIEVSRLWVQSVRRAAAGILSLAVILLLGRNVRVRYRRWRLRRQLLQVLHATDKPFVLKTALLNYACAISGQKIQTLGQWQQGFAAAGVSRQLLHAVQQQCYGPR